MLVTPLNHFTQDTQRASDLKQHASNLPASRLRDDIYRSAWMMAVGACDAYFCDAYADVISRVLRAKSLEPTIEIPDRLSNLRIPVVAFLRQARGGWRWRMAARELVEDDSVLSLSEIRKRFNLFFREEHKIINRDTIGLWLIHRDAKFRCFGITPAAYRKMNQTTQHKAQCSVMVHFEKRYAIIFQRRHDCIHNCDRPKVAVQGIIEPQVAKVIEDIQFLVSRFQDAMIYEYPIYLEELGFSAVTRNQVIMG